MPTKISIHDNHLVGYRVSAKERQIVLHTEFRDIEPHEFTDVIFEEVPAYNFQNDLFDNIIFDIFEGDLTGFIDEYAGMFEAGWPHGWPRGWEPKKESIETYILKLGMKAFILSSSYGMNGWVIAKNASRVKKERKESDRI